jgi:hypothetical protein
MGPAVRRTRPQSRITAAPVQDPNYSGPKVGIAGAVRSDFALKARLSGTEFLDAETGRQKSSRKSANACRDQSPGSKWPEIPAEEPYLASTAERVVCGDWMVVCAVRYEPVSVLISGLLQRIFANSRLLSKKCSLFAALIQWLAAKFPKNRNRAF